LEVQPTKFRLKRKIKNNRTFITASSNSHQVIKTPENENTLPILWQFGDFYIKN
jgi:hypothetical protein